MNITKPTGNDSSDLRRIKTRFGHIRQATELVAEQIRGLVAGAGGKDIVEAELGAEAADLTTAFDALRTCVNTLDPDTTVDPL